MRVGAEDVARNGLDVAVQILKFALDHLESGVNDFALRFGQLDRFPILIPRSPEI